jgi:transposase InsO family protein
MHEFFGFKKDPADDIATHMSKLKNIWTQLNQEFSKDKTSELPELLLLCKILDTLDETYFSFRSSWLLLPKAERTIESLTSHLCGFERALQSNNVHQQEALVSNFGTSVSADKKDRKLKCNYCQAIGHRVRNCKKWIKDGKPPKNSNPPSTPSTSKSANMILMSIESTEICSINPDNETWYVDNGATSHVTNRADLFQNYEHFNDIRTVTTANGNTINAKGKGSVIIEANIKGKLQRVTLQDVWYVPAITKNLFSVLAVHDKIPNSQFSSTTTECTVYVKGEARLIGKRQKEGGLYKLDVKVVLPENPVEVCATFNTMQLYHERLAHQNKRHVKATVQRELNLDLPLDKELCEGCIYGKAHRRKFGTRARATAPGELVHTDVCGPFQPSYTKYQYYVLFKDDYTGYRMVYFLRHKSEVKDKLALMLAQTKTAGHTIKCLLSDNGGEFDNKSIRDLLDSHGINQRLVMPYTPEQNGVSERENRTLVETARSMMYAHESMPQELWAELINTAAYILNRTGPTKTSNSKSPYELWSGKKTTIKHLRIIGCNAFVHIPKQKRKKMNKKAIKGRLVGYDEDGYRVWITDGKRNTLVRSRDVTFDEKPLPSSDVHPLCANNDANTNREYSLRLPMENAIRGENLEYQEGILEPQTVHENPVHESDMYGEDLEHEGENLEPAPVRDHEEENLEHHTVQEDLESAPVRDNVSESEPVGDDIDDPIDLFYDAEPSRYNLRNRSEIRRPERLNDYVCITEAYPSNFADAVKRNDSEEWRNAMESEMKSLKNLKVWTACDLPKGRKALPCKWVLRTKRNPDGSIDRYKARLVVKGFKQRKGIDYDQTFSPVARLATVRALLSVSAQENMYLVQFDVATAFLNGKLEEEIYMQQPEGFHDGTSKVWKLNRSLYGLKQAPRCWNSCFEAILLEMGFKQCEADCCLYTKEIDDNKLLITLYVDDGLVAATTEELANSFLNDLRKKLQITTKPASYYLGLEIVRKEDGSIFINQEAYAKKVLERFAMAECNPVTTPIEKETFYSGKVQTEKMEKFPYREAVGALAYLMVGTRPDIAYAVGVASRKLESPSNEDWLRVKRILRYVKGTSSFGIQYKAHQPSILEGFSDADHGGDRDTSRSTTGVACRYAGGVISWLSQRQASVAISTTEAELVAASEAARELVWLTRIMQELTNFKHTPSLFVDNEAAVRLAHNPEFHKRTKHIRIRHFYVREQVAEGAIEVKRIGTTEQVADILTKGLPRPRFSSLCHSLGIRVLNKGKC